MQFVQSDLTIIGAHTSSPVIYWKGQQVPFVSELKVVGGTVTITVPEDQLLAEMKSAGIKIIRS